MYLIQVTIHKYGIWTKFTDRPKGVILEYIKMLQKVKEKTFVCIHATNTDTGEIRQIWNNAGYDLFSNSQRG